MKIDYGVTGTKRKALMVAIRQELAVNATYLGMPSAAYQIGDYQLDKKGVLEGKDNYELVAVLCSLHNFKAVSEEYDTPLPEVRDIPVFAEVVKTETEELGLDCQRCENIQGENGIRADDTSENRSYRTELSDPGHPNRMEVFTATSDLEAYRFAMDFCEGEVSILELHELDENYELLRCVDLNKLVADNDIIDTLQVEIPKNGMTDIQVHNLLKLVESKHTLLAKALGRPLVIKDSGESILFDFPYGNELEAGNIYAQFATALMNYVVKHRRVTVKERKVDSEKYALRTLMLKLEMNGPEYAASRRFLLRNLSGNSSHAKNAAYTAMQVSRRSRNGG